MTRSLWWLSFRHLRHDRAKSAILVVCIALPILLPAAMHRLIARYETELRARAVATPLVMGRKGNRFDLTLNALYFRRTRLESVSWPELARLQAFGRGTAIPLNLHFLARRKAIVATTPEYYEFRGLTPESGSAPLRLGEVTLGARVARDLSLGVGDALFSDLPEFYDISKPSSLKMRIVGVFAPRGTPDDDAVFVDIKTAWILEGLAHGHDDARSVPKAYTSARSEKQVLLNPAFLPYNEITEENAASYHYHGDPARLPLSCILYLPNDQRGADIASTDVETSMPDRQMIVPTEVVDDLMSFVFRIRRIFDLFFGVLAALSLLMTALVMLLSMRLRRHEMKTLFQIGCSRGTVGWLYATELLLILGASALLAALGEAIIAFGLPRLVSIF